MIHLHQQMKYKNTIDSYSTVGGYWYEEPRSWHPKYTHITHVMGNISKHKLQLVNYVHLVCTLMFPWFFALFKIWTVENKSMWKSPNIAWCSRRQLIHLLLLPTPACPMKYIYTIFRRFVSNKRHTYELVIFFWPSVSLTVSQIV